MTTPTDIKLPHGVRFAEKWVEWVQYRKEIKKSLISPKAINGCLNQLKVVSEEDAIRMIEQSIRAQYQGIFPLKGKKEKEEETQLYRFKDERSISNYKPEKYDRAKGISHMREKLRKNYENGTPIKDMGGIYTSRLKHLIKIPTDIRIAIEMEQEHEATRLRNRFEEQYTGTIESDTREAKLNWFLSECRANKREIWREI